MYRLYKFRKSEIKIPKKIIQQNSLNLNSKMAWPVTTYKKSVKTFFIVVNAYIIYCVVQFVALAQHSATKTTKESIRTNQSSKNTVRNFPISELVAIL